MSGVGVGLIPGGGGSKEFAVRASDAFVDGSIDELVMKEYFMNIAMAKVSTSAWEAFDLKIMKPGRDEVVLNPSRLITESKRAVIEMADDGYTKPNSTIPIYVSADATTLSACSDISHPPPSVSA